MTLNDVIEVLKFCFLSSVGFLFSTPVYFYLIYRFSKLYTDFKALEERFYFLENCNKIAISSQLDSVFKTKE